MNSVERVKTALRLGQPDRVPVLEFTFDEGVARAMVPGCHDVADAMDRVGFDSVGCGARFDRLREWPDGRYQDEWGVTYKVNTEAVAHPLEGPVKTLADARAYTPPDPDAPGRLGLLPELVERYKGRRAITFHHRAAFMWAAYLCGLDHMLTDMLVEPEKAEILMDKALETNMGIVRNAIRAGADVIVLGDDYAHNNGPLMSPAVFAQFIQPRLTRMIDMIHEEGALCIKHTDGRIYDLLDMLVAAGPDGLNPFEPVAGMELARVKRLVGGKVCITGNIDCGELLSHGSVAQVREAVRQAIADAAAGGGYILTSSNSVHSSCNPDNIRAMVEACHEFGAY